jgi:hypothetical protein
MIKINKKRFTSTCIGITYPAIEETNGPGILPDQKGKRKGNKSASKKDSPK